MRAVEQPEAVRTPRPGAVGKELRAIYDALFRAYGPQHRWPGDTPFEVMVGAVLTQNTAWGNVEQAIAYLNREGCLTADRLRRLPRRRLASFIRPSGYYRVKAGRLAHLVSFLADRYRGSVSRMARARTDMLRRELLAVHGIGPETADSILLYAVGHPVFVVDAYTRCISGRHGLVNRQDGYYDVQWLFEANLPRDPRLFNEYHALIVRLGKERCKRTAPRCSGCPIERFLQEDEGYGSIKILRRSAGLHKM